MGAVLGCNSANNERCALLIAKVLRHCKCQARGQLQPFISFTLYTTYVILSEPNTCTHHARAGQRARNGDVLPLATLQASFVRLASYCTTSRLPTANPIPATGMSMSVASNSFQFTYAYPFL